MCVLCWGWARIHRILCTDAIYPFDARPKQIVFKRRHLGSALTWFSTRYKLHAHVYQNKASVGGYHVVVVVVGVVGGKGRILCVCVCLRVYFV